MTQLRGGFKCPWCEHREFIRPFIDDHMKTCPYRPKEPRQ